MNEFSLYILTAAYASVGIVGKIGYWPTIKDLFHKKPSANINTYTLWTMTSGVVFLYALLVLNDFLVKIVAGLDFLSCLTVFALGINLKYDLWTKFCNSFSFLSLMRRSKDQ